MLEIQREGKGEDLIPVITRDGSLTLKSKYYGETFHCTKGAKKEAFDKFIRPSELERFSDGSKLRVLDVCAGLGYNLGCLNEVIRPRVHIKLDYWGIEIDKRPLRIAISNHSFRKFWSRSTLEILENVYLNGDWRDNTFNGKIIWADARETLQKNEFKEQFDLIYLDAFSPSVCPTLWTEEFIQKLSGLLKSNGRIITFCRAAAVRQSLKNAGLQIFSIPVEPPERDAWSNGTVAIASSSPKEGIPSSIRWKELSKMEKEHLETKASIPYRDPTGKSNITEINDLRKSEQSLSGLESTTAWRKRWKQAQSS